MQITTETLDHWLEARESAEFARDKNGAFTHTLKRCSEGARLVTSYRDRKQLPDVESDPLPLTWPVKKLAAFFCHSRGVKLTPESFTWGDGIWTQS